MNTYGYVGGNPLSYSDPYGLCPFCGLFQRGYAAYRAGQAAFNRPNTNNTPPMPLPFHPGTNIPIDVPLEPGYYNEDGSDNVIPLPGAKAPPEQCDDGKKDKGCEALRASMLSSCESRTGASKMKCQFSAHDAYNQCLNEK